jgi:Aerobic-type carbon monoxide dehydrogenase, small subunit CoxS/CutS homologs
MPRLSADQRHRVRFTLNGRPVEAEAEPRMLLTDFLRQDLGMTGTHVGCEHGVCGACTIEIDGVSARACLTLAVQADGATIRTVEALAPEPGRLSVLQEAFRRHHALQCGFCTRHPDVARFLSAHAFGAHGDGVARISWRSSLPLYRLRTDPGRSA